MNTLILSLLLSGYVSNVDLFKDQVKQELGCKAAMYEYELFPYKLEYYPRAWKRIKREYVLSRQEVKLIEGMAAEYRINLK